ncbi:MAG TPA: DUF4288 domain-containing protein [Gemmataceae bacterium]|nr:DUF4288 domain-containing protein [Gemmataceae bacterium]
MGFIPKGARWYLADVILEHQIEDDPRNVVHTNTHLIEAGSPDEAYEKALALGRSNAMDYVNADGKQVRVRFRGLRQLNVIHDDLEDSAELTYEEAVAVPEEQLRRWITPREELNVFAPITEKADVPNYMPQSVVKMLEAMLEEESRNRGEAESSHPPTGTGERPSD